MRKIVSVVLIFVFLIGVTSCSVPKSKNAILRDARKRHGDCSIVSVSKTSGSTTVVLHDELQDFNYTVSSYKSKVHIDGASFGSYVLSKDTFAVDMVDKVVSDCKADFDRICRETGTRYLHDREATIYLLPCIFAEDAESGAKAAAEFAEVLQEHNLEGRMDNWQLYVYRDKDKIRSGELSSVHWKKLGYVKLPGTSFTPAS